MHRVPIASCTHASRTHASIASCVLPAPFGACPASRQTACACAVQSHDLLPSAPGVCLPSREERPRLRLLRLAGCVHTSWVTSLLRSRAPGGMRWLQADALLLQESLDQARASAAQAHSKATLLQGMSACRVVSLLHGMCAARLLYCLAAARYVCCKVCVLQGLVRV